jgi:hypothetical protein
MVAERCPSILQITGEAELLTLPSGKRLAMSLTEMRNEPECLSWTKPRHRGYP